MDIVARIEQAEAELIRIDPQIGKLIELQRPVIRVPRDGYFFSLCRSIIGQQVSVAAAAAIFARFEAATGVEPQAVLSLDDTQVKEIGLSKQKTVYLRDLAQHFVDDPDVYNHLEQATDEEVIAELTAVKGVGKWTAQMFLMFTLSRLDVFAPDDVGIQNGMKLLFGWDELPSRKELESIAERWRPYRTVACWHLWRSLDNTPA